VSLEIIKNTLPYIQPFSIIQTRNGEIIGHYRTEKLAKEALDIFNNSNNIAYKGKIDTQKNKNPIDCWKERINKPKGDQPLKIKKRRIVIDEN